MTIKKKQINTQNISKIEILRQGIASQFWGIILEIMQESKDYIEEQQNSEDMQGLTPEIYKLSNELFKAKKAMIDKLMEAPANMISWLEKPNNDRKDFDPYEK